MQATPITQALASEQHSDRIAAARAARRVRAAGRKPPQPVRGEVLIRLARPGDRPALERLGMLDGRGRRWLLDDVAASSPIVVAESGGELAAAIPVAGGPAVADPFLPTADLVALVSARAEQLAGVTANGAGRTARRLPLLRVRAH